MSRLADLQFQLEGAEEYASLFARVAASSRDLRVSAAYREEAVNERAKAERYRVEIADIMDRKQRVVGAR